MDTTQTAQGISAGSSIENAVMVQAIAALANRWRLRDCAQPGSVREVAAAPPKHVSPQSSAGRPKKSTK
ncbi:hypothetical protein [Burkholderia territorii]|uniref:hypothetical protein n=1 Tax=Burkholderia territorii TaxID=1503055 RepID=UPI0012D93AB0|nr:hypothetical protein [Burkholderia territorii]